MTPQQVRVYPVIDLAAMQLRDLQEATGIVRDVLSAGATVLQLREKGDRWQQVARLWTQIRPLVRLAKVPVIVNDRVDIAIGWQADGVHLGQRDLRYGQAAALAHARRDPSFIIGVSVATVSEAMAATEHAVSYLSVSPVFGTATKTDLARPAGLVGLSAIRSACPAIPIVAIGGICAARVAEVVAAGADGVAFVSAAASQCANISHAVEAACCAQ